MNSRQENIGMNSKGTLKSQRDKEAMSIKK